SAPRDRHAAPEREGGMDPRGRAAAPGARLDWRSEGALRRSARSAPAQLFPAPELEVDAEAALLTALLEGGGRPAEQRRAHVPDIAGEVVGVEEVVDLPEQ